MVKQRHCLFVCDAEDFGGPMCNEESDSALDFTEAAKLALRDGWFIRASHDNPIHLCPEHRDLASKATT